ncbi:hypothetical protein ACQPXH_01150 [Nocardia sp. CA-135953]|uniref:hypothetical protein n=1 Tax=Nocardia sp. CA-135953 TaxID=3239978 RepID=UPI003D999E07
MAGRSSSPQGGNTSTFSVRMREHHYQLLEQIAILRGVPVAELAREFLLDGIRKALDPVQIEQVMDERKQKLLEAAKAMHTAELHNA